LIEAKIDAALAQDRSALRQRSTVIDRSSPDYLPSECLIHLIREGMRSGDNGMANALVPVLLARCEANLKAKIPDGHLANAAIIRDEALGQFGELLASDGFGKNPDELDYFECRFNRAFRSFRIDIVRVAIAQSTGLVSLSEIPDDEQDVADDIKAWTQIREALRTPGNQEHTVQLNELLEALRKLPEDERKAVFLCRVLGFDEESEDPTKITAATLCNTTGRTIRNRLTRAAKKLAKFKEDL
jgi:hypothetical protein